MRFDLSSDSIQFIFFIFVLIVSFLGPKIKNLFESIENEQSHEPQRKTPQLAPRQSAGSKLKNRGANYREVPARSAILFDVAAELIVNSVLIALAYQEEVILAKRWQE